MEPEFCYGNGSCVRTVYPVAFRAVLYLGLGSAVILTVLGNLFVIVAIAHFKQLHTPPNYLALSLAVTDLLLGVLVMFPSMIQSIETCWYFGDMLCKLFNSSDILLCTASILNLSFISIDRYYAVCHPMLYPRKITVHTAVIMILVTWCVSSVVGFGMIFLKLNILGMEEFYYNNLACEGGPMEPEFCYGNGSCVRTVYPVTVRITLYLVLGSAVVLTVLGNLFVIVSISHFKQLHTPTNYLTLSLAVSDFLLGVLIMFPGMINAVETCWYFGDMLCKLYTSSDVLLCTASILNLSFISIDRYYAVCHPMLYPRKITVHTTVVMILVTWCVSAVVGFGMIFLNLNIMGMEEFYYNNVVCEGGCILFTTGVASTLSAVIAFYIPGVIMLGTYLKIYMVAQRQVRTIGLQNSCSSKVDKHQRKATKTLAIIMGVFLSVWLPFFLCFIIDPLIGYSVPPALFNTFVWLGYFNSTINPLVYAFFYSWFRKAFQIIISGRIFRSDMSDTKLFAE
ncbi:unnamed protein product [Boreogadus saida]